jgi:hypothetical protein
MKPNQDTWTIVVAGFWNRMIFMPEWVNSNLFHAAELEKLVPMVPIAPLIYQDDDVRLMVDGQRLILNARKPTDACLGKAEGMATAVLNALPNTPINAVGVNFGFTEGNPGQDVLTLFNSACDPLITESGWQIQGRVLKRELQKDGRTLNLNLTYRDTVVSVDLNFHRQVKSAAESVETLTGKTVEMLNSAKQMLSDVFKLQLEQGE